LVGEHPHLTWGGEAPVLSWVQGDSWHRTLSVGDPKADIYGLVELMDNNPMVCADAVSVPGPAATLAAIALGPVTQAGLLLQAPALQFSFEGLDADLSVPDSLISHQAIDLGSVLAVNAFCEITALDDYSVLDDLYEEAYGRSFFVRALGTADWDTKEVAGRHHAVYDLRLTPGEDRALLVVRVMADRDGKCGAAQMIHALNVMCGWEETLGLRV
jgi:N-acetyl-gamma-glutamylphosphate reductase